MSVTEEQKVSADGTRGVGSQGNTSLSDGGKAEAQNDLNEPQSDEPSPPARNVHGIAVCVFHHQVGSLKMFY